MVLYCIFHSHTEEIQCGSKIKKNNRLSWMALFEAIAEIAFWTAIWNLMTTEK
jgi:hypothetical protein